LELLDAHQQSKILGSLDQSSSAASQAMKTLVQDQKDSLGAQQQSLASIKEMNTVVSQQLSILKKEQEARIDQQNRHSILELYGHSFKEDPIVKMQAGVVLAPPETFPPPPGTTMLVHRTPDVNHVTVHFYLRNVGNAPAINVKPTLTAKAGVIVDHCVDLTHHAPFYRGVNVPCENFVLPPINPRAKNRANPVTDNSASPDYEYDPRYDVAFEVVFQIPPKIGDFSLELAIRADQLVPLFYEIYCDIDFSREE
jgi:hypothetical protein